MTNKILEEVEAPYLKKDIPQFTVGDTIAINHPVTAAWIKFMQMDDLTRDGRPLSERR